MIENEDNLRIDLLNQSYESIANGEYRKDKDNERVDFDNDKVESDETVKEKIEHDRGQWGSKLEFYLSCIGTAVGLGNIWRFPYLCFKYGGGAFLVPYIITLTVIGLPLFFMELALGQFASLGAIEIWNISPLFKGLGVAMVMISAILSIYYTVMISQCMYYFGVSFTKELPWSNCNNSWNNKTVCYDGSVNSTEIVYRVSPAEEYYDKYVLNLSEDISDFGLPQWKLVICLGVAWLIALMILLKGIKNMGKASYFTATFPYIILTILLIKGLTLPGSLSGILFYLRPRFEYLMKVNVWVAAATQIFYSLSICSGNLITVSSYNHFSNDCLRSAVTVALINCGTSLFAGFAVFTNIGFLAHLKNVTMDNVFKGGPGLAFKVYPEALAQMAVAPLWSVLFFLMMISLGISSLLTIVETVLSGFQDLLKRFELFKNKTSIIVYRVGVCACLFLFGIPMTCRGGMHLLLLFDESISGYTMLLLALVEIIVISYCYGVDRFLHDIELMTGLKPNLYWKCCWMAISPISLLSLIITLMIFSENQKYPTGFLILRYMLSSAPLAVAVIIFLLQYCKHGGWLLFRELLKPVTNWGPAKDKHNEEFQRSIVEIQKLDSVNDFFQSKDSIAAMFVKRANNETAAPDNQSMEYNKKANASSIRDIDSIAKDYCESQIMV